MVGMQEFFIKLFGGLVVAFFTGAGIWKNLPRLKRWVAARDMPAVEGTHFTILVAELEDDDEKRGQTKHVIQSLRTQFDSRQSSKAFAVIDFPRVLKSGIAGSLVQLDEVVEQKGRDWLREKNAHLLIWGSVAQADKVIRLRFLPSHGKDRIASGYVLSELLELPTNFKDDLATMIMAHVIEQSAPAFQSNEPLVKVFESLLQPLQNLVTNGRHSLGDKYWLILCNLVGTVFQSYGRQSGNPKYLKYSAEAYRAALEVITRESNPEDWATTQNNLAITLTVMGERAVNNEALDFFKTAEDAYRAALLVRTKKSMPTPWARTQFNLGALLSSMGEKYKSIVFLKRAEVAYRAALEVRTQEAMPILWAATQNNLGAVLSQMGRSMKGKDGFELLRSAETAYRASLIYRTKIEMRAKWASTQNNLGIVLSNMGRRTNGNEALEFFKSSEVAYRAALEVRTEVDMPADWALTLNNYGNLLRYWAEKLDDNKSRALFLSSEANYRETLRVYKRDTMPADWALTQFNIGEVLSVSGEREVANERKSYLIKAMEAYQSALEVYGNSATEYYLNATRQGLAHCEKQLSIMVKN